MRFIVFSLCCFLLIACSGTGTDTPNTIFPTLGRVQIEAQHLDDKTIDTQDSSLCLANESGVMCFSQPQMDEPPTRVTGTQMMARIVDSNNEPLDSSLIIIAECGSQGEGRKQYELYSDSLGEFNVVVENMNCLNLEVSSNTETDSAIFAFSDSLQFNDSEDTELEMTLPVRISGTLQIDSFEDDQQFLVGLAGTHRSIVLVNGESFSFVNVPLNVSALFFYPFSGDINDSIVAQEVYNAEHYQITLNKSKLNELREIRVEFTSN